MKAIPAAMASRGFCGAYGFPESVMRPPSGWWTPPRMFMLVDLPEPFSPTRPRASPGLRSKLTPCRTRTPKKLLVRPSTDSKVESDRFIATGSPHAQIAGAQGIEERRRQDDA